MVSKLDSTLDKVFVNRKRAQNKTALFNKAMREGWSYARFKQEVIMVIQK